MLARDLSGSHLYQEVQFGWEFTHSGVHALITGELREIQHDGEGVTVWLCGLGEVFGDKSEFSLGDADEVTVGG